MIKFCIERSEAGKKLAKCPTRRKGDAGFDFYVPGDTPEFRYAFEGKNDPADAVLTDEGVLVYRHANIPTMVRSLISDSFIALVAENKSGVATGKMLVKGAQVVDPAYRGIIHAHMINLSGSPVLLKYDEKVVQFVPYLFYVGGGDEISPDEFEKAGTTERGEGGFGSTGLK